MKKAVICLALLLSVVTLFSSCFAYTDPLASLREEQTASPAAEKSMPSGNTSGNESGKTAGSGADVKTEEESSGYDFSQILDLYYIGSGSSSECPVFNGYEYTAGKGGGVVKRSVYDNTKTNICADPLCKHKENTSCPFAQKSCIFLVEGSTVYYETEYGWTVEQIVSGEADEHRKKVCSYDTATMEQRFLFDRVSDTRYTQWDAIHEYYGKDHGILYYSSYESRTDAKGKRYEEKYLWSYDFETGKTEKLFKMQTSVFISSGGLDTDETDRQEKKTLLSDPHNKTAIISYKKYDEKDKTVCKIDVNSGEILETVIEDYDSLLTVNGGLLISLCADSNKSSKAVRLEYYDLETKQYTEISQRADSSCTVAAGGSVFYVKYGDTPNHIRQYRTDDGRRFEYTFDCPLFAGEYSFGFSQYLTVTYCGGVLVGEMRTYGETDGKFTSTHSFLQLDLTTGKWSNSKEEPTTFPNPEQKSKPDKNAPLPSHVREIFSDDEKDGLIFTKNANACSVSYNGILKGKLEIPKEYDGLPVTQIAKGGFSGQTELTEIVFPDTLKTVGVGAFEGCTALVRIDIPEGTENILQSAFKGCTSLRDVWLSSTVKALSDECFCGCSSLCAVHFPDMQSFLDCYRPYNAFETVPQFYIGENGTPTLYEGITKIPNGAFLGIATLTEVKIPSTVTEIGDSAFEGTGISELIIPETVKKVGKMAVANCKSLKKIVIPDKCVIDAVNFFYGCSALEKVTLPSTVTELYGTFADCENLREIYLPDSVTTMSDTFKGCVSLEKISFSEKNLTSSIGAGCFARCTSLREIVVRDSSVYITNGKYLVDTGAYSNGCLLFSAQNDLRKVNAIKSVGSGAFENCDFGNSPILLPDSLVQIRTSAFRNSRASFIDVGKGLKTVEAFAFAVGRDTSEDIPEIPVTDDPDIDYESIRMKLILPVSLETVKPFGIANGSEIYYCGTSSQFDRISFPDRAGGNYKIYFYSETRPTSSGSYWHYIDGVPTAW